MFHVCVGAEIYREGVRGVDCAFADSHCILYNRYVFHVMDIRRTWQ